ncbi:MAG: hypothetical protein GVY36_14640 [Verrucomicrobia bacterium]|jgi:hypothetical protein|nr:hypothetical protein [Verrucomicrobiota bacterium]
MTTLHKHRSDVRPRHRLARLALVLFLPLCALLPLEARRGTEPMSAAQRFSMPETTEDGPWAAKGVSLEDTPQAGRVIRVGDIDNFGFGWQAGANPYQGRALRERPPLWSNPEAAEGRRSEDPPGTDRLMAGSGRLPEVAEAPPGTPGYHAVESEALRFESLPSVETTGTVLLQLYLAGIESSHEDGAYTATIDGEPASFLEEALNRINIPDTGGRLLTVAVPPKWEAVVRSGSFALRIDKSGDSGPDPDLFAVDFARLLIDPSDNGGGVSLSGRLLPARGGEPVEGAELRYQGRSTKTDAEGRFAFENLYAGLGVLEATHTGGTGLRAVVSIQSTAPGKHVTLRLRNEFTEGAQ